MPQPEVCGGYPPFQYLGTVGFWKTNEGQWWAATAGNNGVLYKCTSTNTWTLYYTPDTYPHPLQTGLEPDK